MDRGAAGGGGAGSGGAGGAQAAAPKQNLPLNYICGQCNSLNRLSPRDIVRCKECGYRIFYKVRHDRRACARTPSPRGSSGALCPRPCKPHALCGDTTAQIPCFTHPPLLCALPPFFAAVTQFEAR